MQPATALPNHAATLAPNEGETCEAFCVRAHQQLLQAIPEPEQRNWVVWSTWDRHRGNPERQRVKQLLGDQKYAHVHDVQHWQEHESTVIGPDGQPQPRNNDVARLTAIVQECNLRIRDTDSLPGLVDKHTLPPNADDRKKEPPRNLGWAGPFRLGMTGRVNPRFAIFGDEHHRRDRLETLADRPNRSVEVVTLRANGRSYINPIACLAEAPRLPLPAKYSAADAVDGEYEVAQYSAVPAFPGGGNTYVPGTVGGDRKRDSVSKFEADSDGEPQTPTATMALDENDLRQIIDAMMATPQMQFLTQQMQAQQGDAAADPNGPDAQEPMAGPMPPQDDAAAMGGGNQSPGAPAQPQTQEPYLLGGIGKMLTGGKYGGGQPRMREPYMLPGAGSMQTPATQYSAAQSQLDFEDDEDVNDEEFTTLREQYSALQAEQAEMLQHMAQMQRSNAELRARAVDADRRTALQELHAKHPHFVDLNDECDRCLYSAGSQMTDDQFDNHLEDLERYAAKAPPVTGMVPTGEITRPARPTVEQERYEAQVRERSVEIYTAALQSGEHKSHQQCWQEAEREVAQQ